MLRHIDGELLSFLEQTVPPADIMAVSVFRAAAQKQAKEAPVLAYRDRYVNVMFFYNHHGFDLHNVRGCRSEDGDC